MAFILKKQAKILLAAWGITLGLSGAFIFWVISGGPPSTVEEQQLPPPPATAQFNPDLFDVTGGIDSPPLPTNDDIETPLSEPPVEQNLSLVEDSPYGALPRIADDGRAPWQEYSNSTLSDISQPVISIIITGMGLRQASTTTAVEDLPAAISLAFSPYGRDLGSWAERARQYGHDTLLMLPMEPIRYPSNDPGPDTLLRDDPAATNIERMHTVMGQMQGYVGLINDMGSAFTASEEAMMPVLQEAGDRGLMFVDARSTHFSVAAALASDMGVPNAHNNRFIDQTPSEDAIKEMLSALERTAISRGAAVGVARPLPITMRMLNDWAAKLQQEGRILLVPVSTIANRQPIR